MPGVSPVWPGSFLAGLTLAWWLGVGAPDAFYWSTLFTATAALGVAAIAQTFVLVSGSQGLGGGAMISLVSVLVVTRMGDGAVSMAAWIAIGPLLGAAVGVVNGYLVGYRGMSSVAVTLASSMVVYGATLSFLDMTTPPVPLAFMRLVIGDVIPGVLPASAVILAAVTAGAALILRSRLGAMLYAVGRDREAARRAGVPVGFARMIAHVLAGAGYGLAGVVVAGVTGSADPLIGAPTVLQIYAAVAIGGIGLGGGRGGPLGALLGALVVTSAFGLFFIVDVAAYWSTAVEGALLVGGLLLSRSRVAMAMAMARIDGMGVVPAAAGLALVVVATAIAGGDSFVLLDYVGYLLASTILLAVLAVGQAAVLRTGGIDIALPATMALSAAVFAAIVGGSDRLALLGVPVALALSALVGAAIGGMVVRFGLRALFVTLAMTGVLQGVIIDINVATGERYVSAAVTTVLTGSLVGVPILAYLFVGLGLAAWAILDRPVTRRVVLAHTLAGVCAGIAGILGSIEPAPARFGVGDTYLLPSVAAAILGGAAIGGRGRAVYAMVGALLIAAIQILMEGLGLHYGWADVAIGTLLIVALVGGSASLKPRP